MTMLSDYGIYIHVGTITKEQKFLLDKFYEAHDEIV